MRRLRSPSLVLAAALAAAGAHAQQAQPSSRDLYKGKVREGLYEVRSEADLSGVPGIPREAMKSTETRQRCLAKQDIERGVEAGKDCQVKSYKPTEAGAQVVMACKDGTVTDMRYTFAAGGFSSELRTTGTQEGKPFVSVFRSVAKHIGPCPAQQPAAKK